MLQKLAPAADFYMLRKPAHIIFHLCTLQELAAGANFCNEVKYKAVTLPFRPPRCFKASFYISKNRPNFRTTRGFRTKISMELVY